ncbi:hypothetical protein F2Q70_00020078 [Brassica cretica]|uniref:ubiquitinyl hydrolase 1 n=1 Tax=Brassica cretica TaxID=69181 RepID=A0A8S9GJ27_BRACR|nr:hypothetical protein F2Q70_00020078 [Brassica cretica]
MIIFMITSLDYSDLYLYYFQARTHAYPTPQETPHVLMSRLLLLLGNAHTHTHLKHVTKAPHVLLSLSHHICYSLFLIYLLELLPNSLLTTFFFSAGLPLDEWAFLRAHWNKTLNYLGDPFVLCVHKGETLLQIKKKFESKHGVSGEDISKQKFACVSTFVRYLMDSEILHSFWKSGAELRVEHPSF